MTDKLASYIGLAQRAGAVLYGEDIMVERKRLIKVALIDSAATEKYRQRLSRRLDGHEIFEVDELCAALHREGVNAVGITNDGLANAIISLLR